MEVKLDLLDKKILLELDKNSRQSFSHLAKKLNTSKSVVTYRVKQLENKKIIQNYYTVIDATRLGYYHFRYYIKLKETSKEEKEKIIKYLMNSKRAFWVATCTFPYDIIGIFLAKSVHEANSAFREFLVLFKKNVSKYKLNVYVELKHFSRDYILSEEYLTNRKFIIIGEEGKVELSDQEFRVLKELGQNSRAGTVILGKKLKMSPITVKNIIKKLLNERVIKAFRVLVDYNLLDYEYCWVHIDVSDFESTKRLIAFVSMFPETVYIDETIGGSDVELGIQVRKSKGIQEIIKQILDEFSSVITNYEYFKVLDNRKVSYMPDK